MGGGVDKKILTCPGGVAQSTSHSPQEQKSRVRIPQGYKVFKEFKAMLSCRIDLICIVCVLIMGSKGVGTIKKIYLEPILRLLNLQLQHQRCNRLERFSK
jgi:hypothetical protein